MVEQNEQTFMANRQNHSMSSSPPPWQIKVEMALFSLISTKAMITYDELARTADIPPPHRIHKLTFFLEELMAVDAEAGQPLRSAVVISKVRGGVPAPGFFDCCRQLGLLTDDDETGFHQNCLNRLFS